MSESGRCQASAGFKNMLVEGVAACSFLQQLRLNYQLSKPYTGYSNKNANSRTVHGAWFASRFSFLVSGEFTPFIAVPVFATDNTTIK